MGVARLNGVSTRAAQMSTTTTSQSRSGMDNPGYGSLGSSFGQGAVRSPTGKWRVRHIDGVKFRSTPRYNDILQGTAGMNLGQEVKAVATQKGDQDITFIKLESG